MRLGISPGSTKDIDWRQPPSNYGSVDLPRNLFKIGSIPVLDEKGNLEPDAEILLMEHNIQRRDRIVEKLNSSNEGEPDDNPILNDITHTDKLPDDKNVLNITTSEPIKITDVYEEETTTVTIFLYIFRFLALLVSLGTIFYFIKKNIHRYPRLSSCWFNLRRKFAGCFDFRSGGGPPDDHDHGGPGGHTNLCTRVTNLFKKKTTDNSKKNEENTDDEDDLSAAIDKDLERGVRILNAGNNSDLYAFYDRRMMSFNNYLIRTQANVSSKRRMKVVAFIDILKAYMKLFEEINVPGAPTRPNVGRGYLDVQCANFFTNFGTTIDNLVGRLSTMPRHFVTEGVHHRLKVHIMQLQGLTYQGIRLWLNVTNNMQDLLDDVVAYTDNDADLIDMFRTTHQRARELFLSDNVNSDNIVELSLSHERLRVYYRDIAPLAMVEEIRSATRIQEDSNQVNIHIENDDDDDHETDKKTNSDPTSADNSNPYASLNNKQINETWKRISDRKSGNTNTVERERAPKHHLPRFKSLKNTATNLSQN